MGKNQKKLNVNEKELKRLRKIGEKGAESISNALSHMIKRNVKVTSPDVKVLSVDDVAEFLGKKDELIVGTYFKILGDAFGNVLLHFTRDDGLKLSDILIEDENKKKRSTFTPLAKSAIKEVGNIITGAFFTSLSMALEKNIILSVPYLAIDILDTIIKFVKEDIERIADYFIIFKIKFEVEKENIKGSFFIFPDREFLNIMLQNKKF